MYMHIGSLSRHFHADIEFSRSFTGGSSVSELYHFHDQDATLVRCFNGERQENIKVRKG